MDPEYWPVRACQCTFCRTHGALSTSDSRGSVRFVEHVPGALNRYRFGLKSADFLLCRSCGAYIGAVMQSGDKLLGIVNVRVLHSLAEDLPTEVSVDYETEGLADRLLRREKRWTPADVATVGE
jgi:hypothetical protein